MEIKMEKSELDKMKDYLEKDLAHQRRARELGDQPAYPSDGRIKFVPMTQSRDLTINPAHDVHLESMYTGLTKREYFAAKFMPEYDDNFTYKDFAVVALKRAEALLFELTK